MIGKRAVCLFLAMLAAFLFARLRPWAEEAPISPAAAGKAGLLIIAHGSPAHEKNAPALEMEPLVRRALSRSSPFGVVKVAFMEFAHPTVAEGVEFLEKAGCSSIVAVPLLIAHSDHSLFDLPLLLGMHADTQKMEELLKEGAEIAEPAVPVTLTSPLSAGNVLPECLLERVKSISKNPAEEALVIFAHGSEMFPREWESLLRRCASYVCGKTGITCASWTCIHMGQDFLSKGAPVLWNAGRKRKRVLVMGLYLVSGVKGIVERFGRFPSQGNVFSDAAKEYLDFLRGERMIYMEKGLLPDARIASWIAHTAEKAAALRTRAPAPEPVLIFDGENLLRLSIRDAAKYHGDLDACGACAFRALKLAIRELWNSEIPARESIRITSAHPAKGTRDVFEFITRAASRGDLKISLPPGTGSGKMTLDNWVFTFTRKSTGKSVEIRVRPSVFPGGPAKFFALRKKVKFDAAGPELRKRFQALKDLLRDSFLRESLDSLFEFRITGERKKNGAPASASRYAPLLRATCAGGGFLR